MRERKWTEADAWAWLDHSGHQFARSLKINAHAAPITWQEPTPLPSLYRSLPSKPNDCLRDAVTAAEFSPRLIIALGFAFRRDCPERGVAHLWCVGEQGHVIDLSTPRLGPPEGYLGAIATPLALGVLSRANGIQIGPIILDRQATLNRR